MGNNQEKMWEGAKEDFQKNHCYHVTSPQETDRVEFLQATTKEERMRGRKYTRVPRWKTKNRLKFSIKKAETPFRKFWNTLFNKIFGIWDIREHIQKKNKKFYGNFIKKLFYEGRSESKFTDFLFLHCVLPAIHIVKTITKREIGASGNTDTKT